MSNRVHPNKAAGVVVVAAFFAASPGLARAHYAPGDPVGLHSRGDTRSVVLNRIDEFGPKYVNISVHRSSSAGAAAATGLGWTETGAALGAASAITLVATARVALKRRRRYVHSPQATSAGA